MPQLVNLFDNCKAQNGYKDLAELISPKAKKIHNKSLNDFSIVDDASLMHLLVETHFQVLDTNDYVVKLKLVYMASTDHVFWPIIQRARIHP